MAFATFGRPVADEVQVAPESVVRSAVPVWSIATAVAGVPIADATAWIGAALVVNPVASRSVEDMAGPVAFGWETRIDAVAFEDEKENRHEPSVTAELPGWTVPNDRAVRVHWSVRETALGTVAVTTVDDVALELGSALADIPDAAATKASTAVTTRAREGSTFEHRRAPTDT